jgi:hypothetical protein
MSVYLTPIQQKSFEGIFLLYSVVATKIQDATNFELLLESGLVLRIQNDATTLYKAIQPVVKGKMDHGLIFNDCYVVHFDDKLILCGDRVFFPLTDMKCREMRSNRLDSIAIIWKKEISIIKIEKYLFLIFIY